MKTYISTIYSEKVQRMGGRKIVRNIYRVKNNTPVYVWEVEFNTASYKWDESVVMNELARIGEIPKRYTDLYYLYKNETFNIITL